MQRAIGGEARLPDRMGGHYAEAMGIRHEFTNRTTDRKVSVRATCCRCNTEVELSDEESHRILGQGGSARRRHVFEIDTACRECGTNRRKIVVRVVGKR